MKKLIFLFSLVILAGCRQRPLSSNKNLRSDSQSIAQEVTARKFEDTPRIHTSEQIINYLKEGDIEGALSYMALDPYTDRQMNEADRENKRKNAENIILALRSLKVSPKEKWQIKFDTIHFKTHTGPAYLSCISMMEKIDIPLDRGEEPADSLIFVNISFNVTDLHPDPNIIAGLDLVQGRLLLHEKTNRQVEGW